MVENYIVAMSLKTRVQIQMFYQQIKSAAADSDLKTYNMLNDFIIQTTSRLADSMNASVYQLSLQNLIILLTHVFTPIVI